MTLVAVDAVIDISRHVVVVEVVRVVATVAPGALEDGIVARIRVAGRAHIVGAAVTGWKLRVLRMVERGAGPGSRVVAVLARGREKLWLRGVARIGRVVVIRLVTTDTRRWQRCVVVIDVAIRALPRRHRVRSRQRERSVVVIERGVCPYGCVMADFAGRGESGRGVGRIVGAGVILLVARVTQNAVQGVVIVDVAVGAKPRRHQVGTG